ncbi:MAG: molecular chaperone HtpG [Hyphomicrobiaceae bacterium]|nr:molecular chaperone HtpG [Hyphomicrobiaceae bacterium]
MPSDVTAGGHRHTFQAEVSRLLDLMVHSVYTEKEIFLRELISNASDACDKLRYEAIARPELIEAEPRLAITLSIDKAGRRLTIADNGIGMSEAELIDNLGTIAKSGTRAFLDRLAAEPQGATGLIGQFGVGFYSAFMVADRIEVVSRRAGSAESFHWESDGASGFVVRSATIAEAADLARGTRVTLHIKTDADAYLESYEIERIVKAYSDHILFPVELRGDDGNPRQINAASALWQRAKSEVTPEAYSEAYRGMTHGPDEPAVTIHYKAEGRQSYAVLLFVPTERPFDLFDVERKGRVKLYVRRVFITDEAELMPPWLRFVRGVVDSEDVPLNISREMLQNNPMVGQIRRALTGRVVSELESLAEKEPARYETVWETFGAVIKEGLYEDFERRDAILKLARFRTTAGSSWRSLDDYIAAMRPGQTDIYYLAGDSLDRLKASPQLEAAVARGVEVLLLADHVDSFWTTRAPRYKDKVLKSLSQGETDLSAIPLLDDTMPPPEAGDAAAVVAALKAALGDAVGDVRASKRLVTSAVCLVAPGTGPDLALERLLKHRNEGMGTKPVLEINPAHAIVKAAAASAEAGRTTEVADIAGLLLDQARILDGELPTDPARFAERLNRYVVRGLGPAGQGA